MSTLNGRKVPPSYWPMVKTPRDLSVPGARCYVGWTTVNGSAICTLGPEAHPGQCIDTLIGAYGPDLNGMERYLSTPCVRAGCSCNGGAMAHLFHTDPGCASWRDGDVLDYSALDRTDDSNCPDCTP